MAAKCKAEPKFWVEDWKGGNAEVLKLVDINRSCLEHTFLFWYLKYFKSIDVQNTDHFSLAPLFHLIKKHWVSLGESNNALTVESWFLESLIFSNLLITQTKSHFPPLNWTQTESYPQLLEIPKFSNQFWFPLEFPKIGIPLWEIHPLKNYSTIKTDVIYSKCYLYTIIDSLN